tara:strand:+ start:3464 stop:3787 length:324 start_codon:yes stop_codon:yes gene_type:complete
MEKNKEIGKNTQWDQQTENPNANWDKNYPTQEDIIAYNRKLGIEKVEHPIHYGGEENVYEAIKVIEAWDLNFNLGNVVKYISRAGKKDDLKQDLKKAAWYLNRELKK